MLSDSELLANYLAAASPKDGSVWIQELFRRHYPKVIIWCLRFAGGREEAYDLAQAILAKAYRHLGSFRGDSKITTWLYAITRSECMDFLEARQGEPTLVEAGELEDLPDDGSDPEQALEREASARLVHTLLDRALDDTEKKVFVLHFGEDLPLDTITRLLGLPNRSGAKAYLVSARRKLTRLVRSYKARDESWMREERPTSWRTPSQSTRRP
ncbi:MAG: RNA polymerase sigma factor [Anaeromyxobacteraceae bacterium]